MEATHTSLLGKMFRVAQAVDYIEKKGHNDHHRYDFVQALDVVRTIREELLKERVIVIPAAGNVRHHEYKTAKGQPAFLTTVDLGYRFVDIDTGAEINVPWAGVGADQGGDKGVYKAYTGGLKYALLNAFLIPMSNDPEKDGFTEPDGGQDKGHKDDQRPVAPRIPVDRAKAILEAATAVGLVNEDRSFEPVFQALLAQQGVEKIGALNVDQAEAVEAFLAEEAKGNG
jgi:hypothetical protein